MARAPAAAAAARAFVERELGARQIEPPVVEKATLVASELVSNACKYGRGNVEVRVAFPEHHVRLEVIDEGTDQVVRVREQPADETGGWGLRIVDRLAARWGVFEGTTHVWADLPLGA